MIKDSSNWASRLRLLRLEKECLRRDVTGTQKYWHREGEKGIDCSNMKDKGHGLKLKWSKQIQSYFFRQCQWTYEIIATGMLWLEKSVDKYLGKVCPCNTKIPQPAPELHEVQICSSWERVLGKCHYLWVLLLYVPLSSNNSLDGPWYDAAHTCLHF